MKTGNVPELPKPLQMLFADEITKLELFQNALKIILVGTGNVLSPHKYFQFERTLKNVVVNSESAFWDFLESHLLGLLLKASRRAWGAMRAPHGGPPRGWPAKHGGAPWSSTWHPILHLTPSCVKYCMGVFCKIVEAHYPLAFL
jgi:hypothetical protein